MMSRQTPRASGCTSTLRSPASVGLVVSALAAAGGVSKPTLEMFEAASPYVSGDRESRIPGSSRMIPAYPGLKLLIDLTVRAPGEVGVSGSDV